MDQHEKDAELAQKIRDAKDSLNGLIAKAEDSGLKVNVKLNSTEYSINGRELGLTLVWIDLYRPVVA